MLHRKELDMVHRIIIIIALCMLHRIIVYIRIVLHMLYRIIRVIVQRIISIEIVLGICHIEQ